MSIVAQGITFKVKLDVEGAKEDLQRANIEQEKAETAVKSREPRGGTGQGIAGGLAARAAMAGAATVGAAWTIDKAFETISPAFWTFMEGAAGKSWLQKMLKGYYGFDLSDIRREAYFNAQKAAEYRVAAVTAPMEAYRATAERGMATEVLSGRGLTPQEIKTIFHEQYTLRKHAAQLQAAQDRMKLRYEMRSFGEAAHEAMSAIQKNASLW
jgi:hypothetical protein